MSGLCEKTQTFQQLKNLLGETFGRRYGAHPDLQQLELGCQNHYPPAISHALRRILFHEPEDFPLSVRQICTQLYQAVTDNDMEKALWQALRLEDRVKEVGYLTVKELSRVA